MAINPVFVVSVVFLGFFFNLFYCVLSHFFTPTVEAGAEEISEAQTRLPLLRSFFLLFQNIFAYNCFVTLLFLTYCNSFKKIFRLSCIGTWSNGGDHGAMTFLSGYGGQMAGADQGMFSCF